jgi:S1-C subfamily serine protease
MGTGRYALGALSLVLAHVHSIQIHLSKSSSVAICSGFIIDQKDGKATIVTNAHVVSEASEGRGRLQITLADERWVMPCPRVVKVGQRARLETTYQSPIL